MQSASKSSSPARRSSSISPADVISRRRASAFSSAAASSATACLPGTCKRCLSNDQGLFTYPSEESLAGRPAAKWDFRVPLLSRTRPPYANLFTSVVVLTFRTLRRLPDNGNVDPTETNSCRDVGRNASRAAFAGLGGRPRFAVEFFFPRRSRFYDAWSPHRHDL
jgi:hypothetical protein